MRGSNERPDEPANCPAVMLIEVKAFEPGAPQSGCRPDPPQFRTFRTGGTFHDRPRAAPPTTRRPPRSARRTPARDRGRAGKPSIEGLGGTGDRARGRRGSGAAGPFGAGGNRPHTCRVEADGRG